MTKKHMIEQVARKAHLTKRGAAEAVDAFVHEVGRSLAKGEKVVISGFGTFYTIQVKKRTVKIPNSEEYKSVRAHRAPKFRAGQRLKSQVSR